MSKEAFEKKLEALRTLRTSGDDSKTSAALAKALRDPSNYVVAKAAELIAEFGSRELTEELATAFDRLMVDAVKRDPQCWGKTAIAKALAQLGYGKPDIFRRGLQHVQKEPSWGDRADSAAPLRIACTEALVGTDLDGIEILRLLVIPMGDRTKIVRMAAIGVLLSLGRWEGELLLRHKVVAGDTDPEVLATCFAGIVEMGERGSLDFVASFLEDELEMRAQEAVTALAQSRHREAIQVLKSRWKGKMDAELRRTITIALGASPLPEGRDFLLQIFHENRGELPVYAVMALARGRFRAELREELSRVVEERQERKLSQTFQEEFG
ncbi:HEAT repeat domain-containing protein [Bryobacter aggregatus]|uniref:HEAT repeat domain-containing protein n=1 Tax=Bryobacter aggregatus TaxID=360054 RepID=UPI0004E0EFAC|nr:HEAT repeat domain-containing protein [Bryobacter aggregatus]